MAGFAPAWGCQDVAVSPPTTGRFGSRAGICVGVFGEISLKVPERDHRLDRVARCTVFYRTVNIMIQRNITPAEIGDIVRSTRRAAGLRQDELAGAAGVGLRFIVDLEAGKATAQIGKALQVLAALGCAIEITAPAASEGAANS